MPAITNRALASLTWLRAGGPAERLFLPADTDDLIAVVKKHPRNAPLLVLGAGSNVLIRDGGVPGLVIRLAGAQWARVEMLDPITLRVGAGAPDSHLARFAASKAVAGLEFLATIPGTVGGAVAMNAGCYGREIRDILIGISGISRSGRRQRLSASDLDMGYRRAVLPEGFIITAAIVRGRPGQKESIMEQIRMLNAQRQASQPIRAMTGGSTFANPDPPGVTNQRKAWQLLDAAGAREMRKGNARFSDKHCNFLINDGNATAADLESLAEQARQSVLETSGILLDWEIRRYGQIDRGC